MSSERKTRVLYIDDEQNNLNSFRANFRREYEVHVALNAEEGHQILKENIVDVIVADQRMPGMTGVEFFESIIPDYPDPIRILLTGYADIEAVINAINKGQIYKFISKPWNEDTLRIAISNARDIFDARQELKQKNISLQKAYDELDRFVYSVSHDLRAPLVSISGVIQLARQEVSDPKALEYFDMTGQMVDKLDEFIHNIINYYKSTHDYTFETPIDFDKMVKSVFEDYRYNPNARNTRFNAEVNQNVEFKTNDVKLQIILSNLISNAFKFKDIAKDFHEVNVYVEVDEERAVVEISDNGVGIREENREKVFQMFYRDAKENAGSGLGLYLVKEAVTRLGGEIELQSILGEGTRFKVTLPHGREVIAE